MLIDLGDVAANANERSTWNSVPLNSIILVDKDGKRIEVTKAEAEEWAFIGLSNFDFLINKLNETSA